MRNAFAAEITALAEKDERVVLLSGDIGNRLFDNYKERFKPRFFNCGVAEANMMSMAAGMAFSGMRPIAYTITPFITTRCLEQIRDDVCYHNVPVIIVGVGAGLSYAGLGATHHSCEDIAFLRVLPNMTVICPGDAVEVRQALRAALKHDGPVYIRLGKKGEPVVHQQEPEFVIGKAITLREGCEVCLLSTGNLLPTTMQAADALERRGVSAQVVSFHTVKPLDNELLSTVFSRFTIVATIEEHSRLGGFGGSVAEWLTDQQSMKARLCRIGTADEFLHESGGQAFARKHFGLTAEEIAEKVSRIYLASIIDRTPEVTV